MKSIFVNILLVCSLNVKNIQAASKKISEEEKKVQKMKELIASGFFTCDPECLVCDPVRVLSHIQEANARPWRMWERCSPLRYEGLSFSKNTDPEKRNLNILTLQEFFKDETAETVFYDDDEGLFFLGALPQHLQQLPSAPGDERKNIRICARGAAWAVLHFLQEQETKKEEESL